MYVPIGTNVQCAYNEIVYRRYRLQVIWAIKPYVRGPNIYDLIARSRILIVRFRK